MQLGFVIDHDRCIGCHACTVACKAENDVPVGSFRTSVKYLERGTFPAVKRHFLVQRCNHCTDAPCVTICPVNALQKRADGIVDVDRDACIGCRACMQACPYDAIYLNQDSGAVEKCHFCAHRIEVGLEPACVTVCPVNAIIPGDFDDQGSKVSLIVRDRPAQVRRSEQGTGPNVRYVGADDLALRPGVAARPETYIWSDRPRTKPEPWPAALPLEPDARVVLDTEHRVEWGWPVAAYLVTKGIAAGAAILAPFASSLGLRGAVADFAPEVAALLFTALTCFLLVEDLTRPFACYRMLTRPNWRSWLVRGGAVLALFMALSGAILLLRIAGADALADAARWPNALLGLAAAGYTAFLFRQCKGRDLWEGPLLLPHLLVQALLCGSAVLLSLLSSSWAILPAPGAALRATFIAAALAHLLFSIAERRGRHPTENARQAAAFMGEIIVLGRRAFSGGLVVGVGLAIALAIVLPALTFVPALLGLALYEHAYVRAGQLPPLS